MPTHVQPAEPLPLVQGNPLTLQMQPCTPSNVASLIHWQWASAQERIAWDVQVDVAGGGTVTYVDDTLFPIAKVRALQRHHCVPSMQAAAI